MLEDGLRWSSHRGRRVGGVPAVTGVLACGALLLICAPALEARTGSGVTSMYVGANNVGAIERSGSGVWTLDCDGYSGGYITRGPRNRNRINVHYMDGMVGGYSRLRKGRFLIYMPDEGTRVVAVAMKRSARRWDVKRAGHTVGHTSGLDGPEAATALATIC